MQNNPLPIRATGLNKHYGQLNAVVDVDLVLEKGEVLGLLGPNGAGKSTTMQMLTGNLSPSAGEISIGGIDLLDYPRQAKQLIGYLPEQPPVYRDMTVTEYLGYCAALRGISGIARRAAVDTALKRCSISDVARRLIGNLSKGYQQRVGIAQAILHEPDVIILDEPTVGLDPIQIREIRELIRELGHNHSVILSTHILPEVQEVCDRVQIINRGKTVFSDTLERLADDELNAIIRIDIEVPSEATGAISRVLESLPEVESVELESVTDASGLSRWRVSMKDGVSNTHCAATIMQEACRRDWRLCYLGRQQRTLEQIFMGLIHRDAPVAADRTASTQVEEASV